MHMSGAAFLRMYEAGEIENPDRPEVMRVLMLRSSANNYRVFPRRNGCRTRVSCCRFARAALRLIIGDLLFPCYHCLESRKDDAVSAQPHHYRLNAEDELTHLLSKADADRQPVILETPRARYRVVREADDEPAPKPYDPERMIRAIHASAGALTDVDTDAMLRDLDAERTQNSTGRPAK